MSEPNFSLSLKFEVKDSEENEDLNNKTPLTNKQEVDVLVEETQEQ